MTVRELCERMDSRELSEWMAYTRYYFALPDSWEQTGLLVAALLAPHAPKGKCPTSRDFVPLAKPPQHESQDAAALMELQKAFGDG